MALTPTDSQQLQTLSQEVTTLANTVDTLLNLVKDSASLPVDIAAHKVEADPHPNTLVKLSQKNQANGYVGLDANNRALIGPTLNITGYGAIGRVTGSGATVEDSRILAIRSITYDAASAVFTAARTRGTPASPTPLLAGDSIGGFEGVALHSTGAMVMAADMSIKFSADADMGAAYPSSYFVFRNGNNSSVLQTSLTVRRTGIYPGSDNVADLGLAAMRWSNIYASSGVINSSDERLKKNVASLPEKLLEAWGGHVSPVIFQWSESLAQKGGKARIHAGALAQSVAAAFKAAGLDPADYGVWCYDEWPAVPEVRDENGDIIQDARDAGSRFSLRYEQLLVIEAAYHRWRMDNLEGRLAKLEAKN